MPGNFCCATERPSRNLAYARLANQPATDVSSTRSTLHRRRAAPRRRQQQQRARHTPAPRTNECTFALLAPLARPRSTERTTVPTTTEPSRAEPSSTPKSRSRARALRNLPQERKLLPPPPPPRDATRCDATKRNEPRSSPTTPSRALYPGESLACSPTPAPYAARSPHTPGSFKLSYLLPLASYLSLFLSLFVLSPSAARDDASLRHERRETSISRFTLSMLLLPHVSPRKEWTPLSFPLAFLLRIALSSFNSRQTYELRLVPVRSTLALTLDHPRKGHLLSPLCSHAFRSGETAARFARPRDAFVSRTSFCERTLLPSFSRS